MLKQAPLYFYPQLQHLAVFQWQSSFYWQQICTIRSQMHCWLCWRLKACKYSLHIIITEVNDQTRPYTVGCYQMNILPLSIARCSNFHVVARFFASSSYIVLSKLPLLFKRDDRSNCRVRNDLGLNLSSLDTIGLSGDVYASVSRFCEIVRALARVPKS